MRRIRPQPRFWFLLIGIMVISFLCSGCASDLRCRRSLQRLALLTAERNALQETISSLKKHLDFMDSDAWVERTAREELNMIYPDETRYVLGK